MPNNVILIVEDEAAIRDLLRLALVSAGFECLDATNIQQAQQHLKAHIPDLILLDWMLPGGSGINYIKALKNQARTRSIPIIMLTAKAEEHNKIAGLEVGADDYITKPFSPKELIARIRSVLRRGGLIDAANQIHLADLTMDLSARQVTIKGQVINLTASEFNLLHFFLTHPKSVFSRTNLLDAVWPAQLDINERAVDAQIKRLRQRLNEFGYKDCIQAVRGVGYQFIGLKV